MPIMMGRNFWSMDAFRLELKTSATRVCPSMDTGFICRKYILRFFSLVERVNLSISADQTNSRSYCDINDILSPHR